MKKLILLSITILLISFNSNAIGFPHAYSKKKKLEMVENNKTANLKLEKRIVFVAELLFKVFLKYENFSKAK